jgi:hypothetical protein
MRSATHETPRGRLCTYLFTALLTACGTNATSGTADAASSATDAGSDAAIVISYAPDGGVVACGNNVCDLGPIVTPVATLDVCCALVGPGGFGPGGGCGLTDPPPFGTGACAPLKGPGVLDPTCPDIVRPLQTYPGCCTPEGLCGGYANQLFGYTVNYGCGVEVKATAKKCNAPSPAEAAWKPDPMPEAGACTPQAGDCTQECACAQCPNLAPQCLNDPGCVAILECSARTGCTGATCLTQCGDAISQSPNSSARASALGDCVVANCSQCSTQSADAGGADVAASDR